MIAGERDKKVKRRQVGGKHVQMEGERGRATAVSTLGLWRNFDIDHWRNGPVQNRRRCKRPRAARQKTPAVDGARAPPRKSHEIYFIHLWGTADEQCFSGGV